MSVSDAAPVGRIALEVNRIAQLFHTLDPSPFRESDLAPEAEDYIVEQAEELPDRLPIEIVIHVGEFSSPSAFDVATAVRAYFRRRTQDQSRNLRTLFREGRRSLLVGVGILSLCLLLGLLFKRILSGPLPAILTESFLIFGWVAIWKPSGIFLYEWPPIAMRRKLFRRLAGATIRFEGLSPP